MTWTWNVARKLKENVYPMLESMFRRDSIYPKWRDSVNVKPEGVTRESSKLEVGRKSRAFH